MNPEEKIQKAKAENYDSTPETLKHIKRVNELLTDAAMELLHRAKIHDASKLKDPEKKAFDIMTPLLRDTKYGSNEYAGYLNDLQPALEHHYANNSHHPQHYKNGIDGMDLFDLIEMFFDWKAAGERHATGSMTNSININKDRFKMSDQLEAIFRNTAKNLQYE